jgi:hypothetical protein
MANDNKPVKQEKVQSKEAKRLYAETIQGMQQMALNFSQARQYIEDIRSQG